MTLTATGQIVSILLGAIVTVAAGWVGYYLKKYMGVKVETENLIAISHSNQIADRFASQATERAEDEALQARKRERTTLDAYVAAHPELLTSARAVVHQKVPRAHEGSRVFESMVKEEARCLCSRRDGPHPRLGILRIRAKPSIVFTVDSRRVVC